MVSITPPAPPSAALLESMVFEDGLAAAAEAVEEGAPGCDTVAAKLAMMKMLAADVAGELASDERFAADDEVARWEAIVAEAHAVGQQVGAVRALGVAQLARWGQVGSDVWSQAMHPIGHRDEYAGDLVGPLLRLGPHEADRLVDEAVWMVARTPRLVNDVAAGEANLATVAAVATELQDARPETCELVEDAVRRRELHTRASRVSARRSARTLVEGFEAAAARVTKTRTIAQQTGVWVDPHPTPGLTLVSAALPAADAEALMTAVDERATRTHRDGNDGRLLGEHRADALVALALRNVSLSAHVEVITTAAEQHQNSCPLDMLQKAPVVLAPKVGAVSGERLASVLAARAGGKSSAVTVSWSPSDETSETVGLGQPSSGYRPRKSLREWIIRRDQHCRFPGCHRPARFTDLDHVRPWPHGPTRADNLQCLCRRHHRTKQHGWSVVMVADGACTWFSPTGRRYRTTPGRTRELDDLDDCRRVRGRGRMVT